MIIIFFFSSQSGEESGNMSNGILNKMLNFVGVYNVSEDNYYLFGYIIRKTAHFTEYGILGGFLLQFFRSVNVKNSRGLIYGSIICFLYAVTDEVHQIFSNGRGPAVKDVFIDSAGGLFGGIVTLLLVYLYVNRKRGNINDSR